MSPPPSKSVKPKSQQPSFILLDASPPYPAHREYEPCVFFFRESKILSTFLASLYCSRCFGPLQLPHGPTPLPALFSVIHTPDHVFFSARKSDLTTHQCRGFLRFLPQGAFDNFSPLASSVLGGAVHQPLNAL